LAHSILSLQSELFANVSLKSFPVIKRNPDCTKPPSQRMLPPVRVFPPMLRARGIHLYFATTAPFVDLIGEIVLSTAGFVPELVHV
jgi:hypothetical protein